ncbi:MAG: transporter [Acidimicrobiales bacterium]|nr:transporter [Acidimicrobiales bacterium]
MEDSEGLPFARAAIAVVAGTAIATSSLFTVSAAVWVCRAFDASAHYSVLLILQRVGGGVGTLVGGGVVDRKGMARVFRWGALIAFVTAACTAVAPWFVLVLALRFVGGLGSGFCQAAAVAAVPAVGRQGDRVRLFGASSATWGTAGVLVPFTVVTAIDLGGWRAAYGLEALLALVGLVAFPLAIRGAPKRALVTTGRFDTRGLVLISGTALAVQLAIGWHEGILVLAPTAAVFAVAFWWHAGRTPRPIFTRAHVAGRVLLPYHLAGGVAFLGAWGLASVLPLVVRDGLHASSATGALALTLSSSGWLGGSLLTAGPLGGIRPRTLLLCGFGVQAVLLLAGAAGASTSTAGLLAIAGAVGLAGGVANNASLGLASAAVPPEDIGRSLAALQFLRSVASGSGAGAAAALAVSLGPLAGLRVAQAGAAALTIGVALLVAQATAGSTVGSGSGSTDGNPSTTRSPGNSRPQVAAMASVATPPSTTAPPGPSS